jgi:hypothetical protein
MNKVPDATLDRIFAAIQQDTSTEMDSETRAALERLICVAQSDTGQSRHIADLLLAWWDTSENGGFDFRSFWNIDDKLVTDSLKLIKWISGHRFYPDELGYGEQFKAIWKQWRSGKSID